MPYAELAAHVLHRFAGDCVSKESLRDIAAAAYGGFDDPDVAPLRDLGNGVRMLELYHGPTLSFKDYALQFLGRFMHWSLKRHNRHLTVVGATSGDTGSAAIFAVQGLPTIDLFMLHPHERVSTMQRLQMTTNDAANIHNFAVSGTFDDCQAIVKQTFADVELAERFQLGAVNSINWGRIAAQVVYYFHAAAKFAEPHEPVSFVVPTGNFGNVFAGYVAFKMGLPVRKLIVCSNENDIVTRFFHTAVMQKRAVKATLSPSMDIQVSSNFERFLFDLLDREAASVSEKLAEFANTGQFSVDAATHQRACELFDAFSVSDDETCEAIAYHYAATGTLVDPHTAIALAAAQRCHDPKQGPTVVISTAHPAKFSDTIERVTGQSVEMPEQLESLRDRPEICQRITSDAGELKRHMLRLLKQSGR